MYNRGLFYPWVPKPLQLVLILIMTIPVLSINGIYSGNIGDMYSSLGILAEDLTMANYAATIGMMAVFPLIMKTKQRFKAKHLMLTSFISAIFLSYVSATTHEPSILILCNFLLGGLKMFAMIEVIIPVMSIISPSGDRGMFYCVFYPFSIVMGQLSGYFTVHLAYLYNWQYVYYFAIAALLLCTLLTLIFVHDSYASKPVPLYRFDWLSMVILCSGLMLLNYFLSYGRMLDWFHSVNIQGALIGFVVLLIWFIQRQMTIKRPYLALDVFKKKNVYSALFFIALMGIFMGSGNIQSAFLGILKYSPITNSQLNLFMGVGAVLAGLIAFIWFKKKWSIKGLIFLGFSGFILYHVLFYFLFSPIVDIEYFVLPIVLKGFGLTMLYISIGIYLADKLAMSSMLSASAVLVLFRSFIGPAMWGAFFSTELYQGTFAHTAAIVQRMDALDPSSASRINQAVQGSLAQGRSLELAQSMGTQSMWGAVQVQATLAAGKEIYGYIIIGGGLILFYTLMHRFRPVDLRKLVNFRRKIRGQQVIKREEEMMAAAVV